ncbi:MAG: NAD(+)/NADH kinase [Clostridia bacterium]|nr:NAD(+)/NADH kinase [Clostridia bacterium]
MKRIAIITNFNIYEKANAAIAVAERLADYGATVLLASINKDRIFRMHKSRKEYVYLALEELYREAEAIVVLGGDGSLLDAARRASPFGKPLLGINMGRLGFMSELEMNELDALQKLVTDEFTLDRRAMLHITVKTESGGTRAESFALNDAVISNGSVARIVDLELSAGGMPVTAYRADGVIVSTPTGSTAYSMSAGGPVIDPHLGCFCVTPICSHSLTARPIIFRDDTVLSIKNTCQREKMLYLTVDGRVNFEIYRGDSVTITRSSTSTALIRFTESGFYNRLKNKMNSYD